MPLDLYLEAKNIENMRLNTLILSIWRRVVMLTPKTVLIAAD